MTAIRNALPCALLFVLASIKTAGADSEPASASVCACAPPANGAMPNEDLDARAERLRLAMKLTDAERAVRAAAKKRSKR